MTIAPMKVEVGLWFYIAWAGNDDSTPLLSLGMGDRQQHRSWTAASAMDVQAQQFFREAAIEWRNLDFRTESQERD